MFFRQLTFDKKRHKILIMENLTKMKEIFNKLALVTMLAGSVLSFNSCKEQIHGDNPVDPIVQPDKPNTPSVTDERLHTIGNGNYQFRNFMYENGFVDEKVKNSLNDAKSYRNVMLGNLNKSLEGNSEAQSYFADYIANLESVQFRNRGSDLNPVDIDAPIVTLNEHHKPIMVEIVKNINTPLDQDRFIRYYESLTNEAYKHGFGSNFNNDAVETYEMQKSEVIRKWAGMHRVTGTIQLFDIEADMNSGYTKISNRMDQLLTEAASNIGNGVTLEHLRSVVNNSFIINSLDAIHDSTIQAHYLAGCMSLETEGTIVEAMDEVKSPLTQTNMVMNERSL